MFAYLFVGLAVHIRGYTCVCLSQCMSPLSVCHFDCTVCSYLSLCRLFFLSFNFFPSGLFVCIFVCRSICTYMWLYVCVCFSVSLSVSVWLYVLSVRICLVVVSSFNFFYSGLFICIFVCWSICTRMWPHVCVHSFSLPVCLSVSVCPAVLSVRLAAFVR